MQLPISWLVPLVMVFSLGICSYFQLSFHVEMMFVAHEDSAPVLARRQDLMIGGTPRPGGQRRWYRGCRRENLQMWRCLPYLQLLRPSHPNKIGNKHGRHLPGDGQMKFQVGAAGVIVNLK